MKVTIDEAKKRVSPNNFSIAVDIFLNRKVSNNIVSVKNKLYDDIYDVLDKNIEEFGSLYWLHDKPTESSMAELTVLVKKDGRLKEKDAIDVVKRYINNIVKYNTDVYVW